MDVFSALKMNCINQTNYLFQKSSVFVSLPCIQIGELETHSNVINFTFNMTREFSIEKLPYIST